MALVAGAQPLFRRTLLDPVDDRKAGVRLEAGSSEERHADVAGEERVTAGAELGSPPFRL